MRSESTKALGQPKLIIPIAGDFLFSMDIYYR